MNKKSTKTTKHIIPLVVAISLALVMLFYFFTFRVRVIERAVVTTFGQPTRSIDNAGLYWKLPYPFQKKYTFDARLQVFTGNLEQVFTSDHKTLIVQTYVGWKIEDPKKFLIQVGTLKKAQKTLEDTVRSNTNGVIAKHPFSHLISQSSNNTHFAKIEEEIKFLINSGSGGTKENLGISVHVFGIKRLDLPEQTTEKVFDRMRAERNRIAEAYRSEGEGDSQIIRNEADAEKRRILITAQAEAKKIMGQGDAAAAKHYQTFAKNMNLAIWLRKLESLEKLLGEKTTLLVDPSVAPFDLLRDAYNDLPELKKEASPKTEAKVSETNKLENGNLDPEETKQESRTLPQDSSEKALLNEVLKEKAAEKINEKRVESEVPEFEVPEFEVPKSEAPESEVPKSEVPESEVPESEVPESEVPKSEVPKSEVPESEVPESEIPEKGEH